MEWNWEVDVWDGGYVRGGVGGGSTFICKDSVDGSSFLIPNLFTLNPVPQYSWFHQMTPNVPSSVLLLLCAIRNSLLNRLTFSAWISTARHILLILFLSACFFLILILSVMSSGSRSWMLYRHVSRWWKCGHPTYLGEWRSCLCRGGSSPHWADRWGVGVGIFWSMYSWWEES